MAVEPVDHAAQPFNPTSTLAIVMLASAALRLSAPES
jgi:hypothetical protein